MTDMRPHETIRGRILYTSRKPGREGAERGREHFTITVHRDGRRTLEARCEIDDPPNVLRTVVLTVDAHWVPRDAFVRVSVGDRLVGSSWFCLLDDHAECEGVLADRGRISERVEYERPPVIFVTHAIQSDAWHLRHVDRSRGPCVVMMDRFLMTSADHRGATGPSLVWHDAGFPMEFVGEEPLTVSAGTFDALHFCFGDRNSREPGSNAPGQHPPYEVWTTSDGELVMLKATVGGYMMTHYELVELERIPADTSTSGVA
jgi:hypothetical protein